MYKLTVFILILVLSGGCAEMLPKPLEPSDGHISAGTPVAEDSIPDLVEQVPVLPDPEPVSEPARYTVVVNEVPVKELLFALARDAELNVDIHPQIGGVVTINAVDQTLPQILNRIARQVDLRYEFEDNNLIISPDRPFVRNYNVGYLNLSRDTAGTVTVSTQIASASSGDAGGAGSGGGGGGGGGGSNTSTTDITSASNHHFWENLQRSIASTIDDGDDEEEGTRENVIINPESGVITVRATANQHRQVQELIDQVLESVQRQVLIQATVVEVTLSDQFQAGIDWSIVNLEGSGFTVTSDLLGAPGLAGPPSTSSSFVLDFTDPRTGGLEISAAVSLLSEFGDTRVLSSPQIMVLNNHTAVLKVVENFVYFEVEQDLESGVLGSQPIVATTTTARTIPVGLVMTVTPQVSKDDSVIFNVRPTISSVLRTELDPNPALTQIQNRIPVVRVREMESILRVNSNQVAVLGGLMQDTLRNQDRKTPFISDIPLLGNLFKARSQESLKTELVIFLRPVVIKHASVDGDLQDFRRFLEESGGRAGSAGGRAR